MRRPRTQSVPAPAAPTVTASSYYCLFLLVLASFCWMDAVVMVDAAHPQRLVKDFMDDGTPVWQYVDLPPLEMALDSMDGKRPDPDADIDVEVEVEGRNLGEGGDADAEDHPQRDLRELQSANGCPSQNRAYSFEFVQDVYIILYDVTRTMRPGEQRSFEKRVLDIWNDPRNNCFTSCFYIDSVTVIEQTLLGDHDADFDFITINDSQDDRRDLVEEQDDFALTLEAALSDDDEEEEHRRLDPGHRHRRKRNRVKTKANGRCRSACRKPIKARDRRLHELEEDQRMVDISSDGQISDYFQALGQRDDYYQPAHRRLFGCQELLQNELQDMAVNYRGVGDSAFNCLSSLRVSTAPDVDECIHTHHSSSSRSSVWSYSGKGGGKGDDYRSRASRSFSAGKGKGGDTDNTYRTQNNNYYGSKSSKGGNYYGSNYRTSYYGASSKGSKGSF